MEAFATGVIGEKDAKIKELQETLGEFQGANPGLGVTSETSGEANDGEMSHLEAARLIKFGE